MTKASYSASVSSTTPSNTCSIVPENGPPGQLKSSIDRRWAQVVASRRRPVAGRGRPVEEPDYRAGLTVLVARRVGSGIAGRALQQRGDPVLHEAAQGQGGV